MARSKRHNDQDVIKAIQAFREEGRKARLGRLNTNRINNLAFQSIQDWSGKIPGQSCNFIPKVRTANERLAAHIESALTRSKRWFQVRYNTKKPNSPEAAEMVLQMARASGQRVDLQANDLLPEAKAEAMLDFYLGEKLVSNTTTGTGFADLLTDSVKLATLEACCALKFGTATVNKKWRLRCDLVPLNELFIDPEGRGLFLIHEYEMDLYELRKQASDGVYDVKAVAKVGEKRREVDERKASEKGQNASEPPSPYRKRCVITEYWGTLLDDQSYPIIEDGLVVVANDEVVIRKPGPSPYRFGVPILLMRPMTMPLGVFGLALFDDPVNINIVYNELHNLFVDGALGAVWGINQLRHDYLVDARQTDDGIPQGETLIVSSSLPPDMKVLEPLTSGKIPPEVFAAMSRLDNDFAQASFSTELSLGALPQKQTRATEVIAGSQAESAMLDTFTNRWERQVVAKSVEMFLQICVQQADKIDLEELKDLIGTDEANRLQSMAIHSPEALDRAFGATDIVIDGTKAATEKGMDILRKLKVLETAAATLPIAIPALALLGLDGAAIYKSVLKDLDIDIDNVSIETTGQDPAIPQGMQQLALGMPGAPGQGGGDANAGGQNVPGAMAPQLPAEVGQRAARAVLQG